MSLLRYQIKFGTRIRVKRLDKMNSKVESFIWLPWFNDEFWTTNGVCRLILIEYF